MAPMVLNHLSEVMQPTRNDPRLYVGTRMDWMIKLKMQHLEAEVDAEEALKKPFNKYLAKSSPQDLPRFVDKFTWPDQCEIRTLKPEK